MNLYLFIELITIITNLIIKNITTYQITTNIIKILPFIINLIISLMYIKKIDKRFLGLFVAITLSEYLLIFKSNYFLGVSTLIAVQTFYYLFINDKKINSLYITTLILNIVLSYFLEKKVFYFELTIYTLISIINIISSIKRNEKPIILSLTLLIIYCIGLTLNYMNPNNLIYISSYYILILSQITLLLYATHELDSLIYRLFQPVFTFIFFAYYNPQIINKEYLPKEGPCVIAGNHKHALDPIFVDACTHRVVHTLAKKELHDSMFGWFFRAVGTIPVNRQADHNKAALDTAINYLNEGYIINVSPEGKVNFTNEILLPFKYGAVVMAKRTNCKVIPYSITGDYKFRSKNLKIIYGKPLDMSELSVEEANELLYNNVKKLIIKGNKESVKNENKRTTMV